MTRELSVDREVWTVFDAQPAAMREALLGLRALILSTAKETPSVGPLLETLKWGEPAYLPLTPRVGTTIRINAVKGAPLRYAAFFHCQTTLVDTFRHLYPDTFSYEGQRAIVLTVGRPAPEPPLKHCIALALTYHLSHV